MIVAFVAGVVVVVVKVGSLGELYCIVTYKRSNGYSLSTRQHYDVIAALYLYTYRV